MSVTRDDRGSALMLMPAAVLIVFLLGSIALDFSIVYLRQRQALNLAADAANDAAIEAVDLDEFRSSGTFVLDPASDALDEIEQRYEESATFASDVLVDLQVTDTDAVTATVTVDYRLVFAGLVPGADRERTVEVDATALARDS